MANEQSSPGNGRRVKHVTAREVGPAELKAFASPAHPATVAPTEGMGAGEAAVLDPTLFGRRRRRRSHQRMYHLAQAGVGLSLVCTVFSVFCALMEGWGLGQTLGSGALVFALAAVVVGGKAAQAGRRLRGYAIAAAVLAALSIGAAVVLSGAGGEQNHPQIRGRR